MGVEVVVEGISRRFQKGGATIEVLRDASVTLAPGESVALVGQSDSGKSTFLHILGGLEPPDTGAVRVDGAPLHARPARELERFRNQVVGFIFQFHHLLPDHDAVDNVAMPLYVARWKRDAARDKAAAALDVVGLGHRKQHKPGELSGGEQQRVAIARALINDPGLVLADEPTGNLDPATAEEVMALLMDLNGDRRATLVVVTHSMELAARFPRRLRLRDGQFVEAA